MSLIHQRPAAASTFLTAIAAAVAVLGGSMAGSAGAQEAGTAPAESKADPAAKKPAVQSLDAVVITAGKRTQAAREIAGTVSVEQGAALEARGAKDAEDIFKFTPGVQFNKAGGPDSQIISIRGVNTEASLGAAIQSTTGIYVEDIPFTDPFVGVQSPDFSPFDLERVEVLKGPQGALYGSQSLGGAIRYLVNKPDLQRVEGSVLGGVNKVSQGGAGYSGEAMVNVPLKEGVAGFRVVAFDRKDAGYIDNLGTGTKDANDVRQHGGRLLLTVAPNKDWKVTGIVLAQQTKVGGLSNVSPDPQSLTISTPVPETVASKWSLATLQVEGDLGGGLKFTSLTGYLKKDIKNRVDLTRNFGDLPPFLDPTLPAFPAVQDNRFGSGDATSQEFRLSSSGGPLSYVVGVAYQKYNVDTVINWRAPGGEALLGAQGPAIVPGDNLLVATQGAQSTESAVFADGEYTLGAWSFGLGARYYRTTLDVYADFNFPAFASVGSGTPNTGESGVTPKASVKYRFSKDAMWYASAAKGYRFGGANIPGENFKSDTLWNYETGVRLAPLPGVTLDVSAFYIDWKDVQVQVVDPSGFTAIANAGAATVKGAEVALGYNLGPFYGSLSTTYTDAKTTVDFTSVPSGTRLPGTPYLQAAATGAYRFEAPFGTSGTASIAYSFVGERQGNLLADPITMPAYGTLDLRTSFAGDQTEVSFYVNNATDKRGVSAITTGTFTPYRDYALVKPRTIGVNVRYDF